MTAQAIHEAQQDPKPPLETSLLIREQHFGIAEGNSWLLAPKPNLSREEHYTQGVYPVIYTRQDRFPQGESLDDLSLRAEQAISELVLPHVWSAARQGFKGVHVAVVSHGLCIGEMVPALLRKDHSGIPPQDQYRGLKNTAWIRVTVDVKVDPFFVVDVHGLINRCGPE